MKESTIGRLAAMFPAPDLTVEEIIALGFSTRFRGHTAKVDLEEQFREAWERGDPRLEALHGKLKKCSCKSSSEE